MQTYRLTLRFQSALGTPLAGDTLLGQLCWTLRHQLGNSVLTHLLEGYTQGKPFAVVSDAMPSGHLPLPSLPSSVWQTSPDSDRKALKKKRWLPLHKLRERLPSWQQLAVTDSQLGQSRVRAQPHNTINRQTGTTGIGMFAPYSMEQIWLTPDCLWDIIVVLDTARLTATQLYTAFTYMGQHGFGRDASIGLGKFELVGKAEAMHWDLPATDGPNAWLTLGPCAPQGQGFCPVRSHWHSTTRFGRHGDIAAQAGQPYKRPILMAKTGSVFWPERLDTSCLFIGQGLGGIQAPISLIMPETIHQAYAPVVPIQLPGTGVSCAAGASA